ncbi:TetR/AcrR family transcriptional regulator [Stackebrandtia nassauensis]|uniref:Transcriptional regulator, TetR family n=1 Tax=Stackebrandtia nassauensis (strain DSM 44728 / CIP 108903 / NRRL B-16338 / NBRC 102104 / LLR-40K-21) TaxID=446470 RepID=D3PUL5_STANL|nr:TetR/AcrR family transcriptional regulator [Stackebrandtia nassauensis]ADD43028.1 transcriptional regulator, TetR family [Stackebrandtia nassauensis DSM 44728]
MSGGEKDGPTVVSRTGPKRSDSARLAVLHAADDLLAEKGFSGVTIEGIATRAGVAKQTVYRWWKSKVDILIDTLVDDADTNLAWPPEDEDPPVVRLRHHLGRVNAFLTQPAGQVLRALLGHAQLDPAAAAHFAQRFGDPQRERDQAGMATILDLPRTHPKVAFAVSVALGPLYHRLLTGQAPLDESELDELTTMVLGMY